MPTTTVYRLEIAPLTPLPLTRSPFFSYRSDMAIPLGSLVQVPFGRQSLRGIVYECAPLPGRPPLWMKPIERVIAPSWLEPSQRALALWISETYYSSLGNTLKHFVFPLPKKIALLESTALPLRKTKVRAAKETACEFASDAKLTAWLTKKIQSHVRQGNRVLIVMPDLLQVTLWEAKLRPLLGKNLTTITSRLTHKGLADAWQAIRADETCIILGTRQALFAPLGALKEIIFCSPEETLSYKQWDMTPYYEATAAARWLAQSSGAALTWMSPVLGLRERVHFPKAIEKRTLTAHIINRREDGKGARSKAIGKALVPALKSALGNGPILLIAKERGVTGITVCQSCRTTARCPKCDHLLGEAEAGHLRCLSCGYTSDIFPRCRACGGMHFQGYGLGTVRVAREVERLFPAARILRLDRDQLATQADWNKMVKMLLAEHYDILVTTQEIGSLLPLPPLSLAALLEGDQLLAAGHYANEERLLLIIERLAGKLTPTGELVVQTFAPEERLWQSLFHNKLDAHWDTLREERILLGYPPAAAMIQLTPAKDTQLSRKEFEAIRSRLATLLETMAGYTLTPIFERTAAGRQRVPSFLVKYPETSVIPERVSDWLKRESRHLRIDVHPFRV